jgi:integrase
MEGDLRRMEGVIRELGREGDYTVEEIMARYKNVMSGNSVKVYAERLAEELDRNGYERTARAYRTAAARLVKFNGGVDVKLERITAPLVGDFQQTLKVEGRSMNTISFYMRTLRAIYNKAVAEGRIPHRIESPFSGVYTGVSATRKLALTSEELARLSAFDPTAPGAKELPENFRQSLAMFLFCYHARGMCYVDMANLKKSDLQRDTIRYSRQKTGQQIEIKVQPSLRRILDWFAPQTAGSEYLFPVIADKEKSPRRQYESGLRTQNQRLKLIAKVAGIQKRFSTHCARHSWATVARNEGLPLAVISEGLGHTNQKTTEIYLASLERSVLDHASRVVSEAIDPHRKQRKHPDYGDFGALVGYRDYGFRSGVR